jgi:hypothetical protein
VFLGSVPLLLRFFLQRRKEGETNKLTKRRNTEHGTRNTETRKHGVFQREEGRPTKGALVSEGFFSASRCTCGVSRSNDPMSSVQLVLFYSQYDELSQQLIQRLSRTHLVRDMDFVCIDAQVRDAQGQVYVVLAEQHRVPLPPMIQRVPSLMELSSTTCRVLVGADIPAYLQPRLEQHVRMATQEYMEPRTFQDGFQTCGGGTGVVSESYSSFSKPSAPVADTKLREEDVSMDVLMQRRRAELADLQPDPPFGHPPPPQRSE